MGPRVGVLAGRHQRFLVAHDVEESEQPAPRLAGPVEEGHGRLVGRRFLHPAVFDQRAPRHRAAACDHRRTDLARARDNRCRAEDEADDRRGAGVAQGVLGAGQMTAGDMAGFVGDHADQLIGRLDPEQEAGEQEDPLAAGDEGIQLVVVDQVDPDRARVQPGGPEHWRRVQTNGMFDLRVPDDRETAPLGPDRGRAPEDQRNSYEKKENAAYQVAFSAVRYPR